jgi:hypothetical protein
VLKVPQSVLKVLKVLLVHKGPKVLKVPQSVLKVLKGLKDH